MRSAFVKNCFATALFSFCSHQFGDAIFILVFRWGLFGAAFATALSQAVGSVAAQLCFARKNGSLLRLVPQLKLEGKTLWKACTNGASEMVGNLAASVVTMLYNAHLYI